jgi:hypothetical protein
MKRFFISAVVSMACFMAHAQSITIPTVKIGPGCEKKVDVSIPSGTDYTAFQFDIALPEGISVTGATLNGAPDTRKISSGIVGGKFRVLSYDEKNTKLTNADAILSLTFAAEGNVTTGEKNASIADVVLVEPEGETPQTTGGDVAINVVTGESITIGTTGKTTFVSDLDLDFSSFEDVKAYILTGYDLSAGKIYLTRITDVPANTPIWVTGPEGTTTTKTIPLGSPRTYYPTTFMVGSATSKVNIPAEDNDYLCWTLMGDGKIAPQTSGATGYPAGKAYLRLPKAVTSSVGSAKTLTMSSNKTTLVYNCDLDFTDVADLKAYAVTGYDIGGTMWLTRVMRASAGTPLYLKSEGAGDYTIPSSEQKMAYVNMLKGDASNPVALTPTTDDGMTNFVLYGDGKWSGLTGNANYPAGKAYLPVPSSYIPAASRGIGGQANVFFEEEPEMIVVRLDSTSGENDGTTGIRELKSDTEADVWYNLKGQRIDAPTKKGLYIKNGVKVVVK